jgi:CubicO group peptidase (beta-lactamase class C family)
MLDGHLHPDFADVAAVLIRQIPERELGGAAVCVYHRGEKVVDIWGGSKDREGNAWEEDTVAPSFSTTKGVMSTLLHILVEDGLASYDDAVADHWPEFGANGKEAITIRHVLTHEAGLYRASEVIQRPDEMRDWDHMKARVAAASPAHAPGAAHGYHALTYGWLLGGLIEAITDKPLQRVLLEELAEPLDLDGCYIGLPHNELYRRAKLITNDGRFGPPEATHGVGADIRRWLVRGFKELGIDFDESKAALLPFDQPVDWNDEATVQAVIPAANGQFTARSLARVYAMIAGGGQLDDARLLSPERVQAMGTIQSKRRDRVLHIPMHWRLGYHRAFAIGANTRSAFGHYGFGGSGALCDPKRQLSVAMTVNSGGGSPTGGSRIAWIAGAAMRAAERAARRRRRS